jgi:hypothetical protein
MPIFWVFRIFVVEVVKPPHAAKLNNVKHFEGLRRDGSLTRSTTDAGKLNAVEFF